MTRRWESLWEAKAMIALIRRGHKRTFSHSLYYNTPADVKTWRPALAPAAPPSILTVRTAPSFRASSFVGPICKEAQETLVTNVGLRQQLEMKLTFVHSFTGLSRNQCLHRPSQRSRAARQL
jgi:hypothetical protein